MTPQPTTGFRCRACGHAVAAREWKQRERAYGMPGEFDYGECAACGALSLLRIPPDLAAYYPRDYGAHARNSPLRLGWLEWLTAGPDPTRRRLIRRWVSDRATRILDVGCGNARLLRGLACDGYTQLHGIDLFLPPGLEQEKPFPIRRQGIADCTGEWDVIMYHHVLEHVPDPVAELRLARARLRPGGRLLLAVPLADSWACERHGLFWPQWDAPRHVWLPTRAAMARLAAASDCELETSLDDSTPSPLWMAPMLAQGMTLRQAGLQTYRGRWRPGNIARLLALRARARALNRAHRGDQGCFVYRRAGAAGGESASSA
jgi:SAM-dependent methyltransferase